MTGKRASTSVLSLAACFMLWSALMVQSARAQDAGRTDSASSGAIRFDLPAQPLAQALQAYGRVAELSVMGKHLATTVRFFLDVKVRCTTCYLL
jgi:hypothetical protein